MEKLSVVVVRSRSEIAVDKLELCLFQSALARIVPAWTRNLYPVE